MPPLQSAGAQRVQAQARATAEQAELGLRQTHPIPTEWGIVLDPKMRITRASSGFPAADSKEFSMLVGWTLVGVNGRPIQDPGKIRAYFSSKARPGETITLRARAPLPGEDDAEADKTPCNDWREGCCGYAERCAYRHDPAERGVDAHDWAGRRQKGEVRGGPSGSVGTAQRDARKRPAGGDPFSGRGPDSAAAQALFGGANSAWEKAARAKAAENAAAAAASAAPAASADPFSSALGRGGIPPAEGKDDVWTTGAPRARPASHHDAAAQFNQQLQHDPAPKPNPFAAVQSCRLIVKNLAPGVGRMELEALFAQFGDIHDVHIPSAVKSHRSGARRNAPTYGFIEFRSAVEARQAIEQLNGKMLKGMAIQIKVASGQPLTREMFAMPDAEKSKFGHMAPHNGMRRKDELLASGQSCWDIQERAQPRQEEVPAAALQELLASVRNELDTIQSQVAAERAEKARLSQKLVATKAQIKQVQQQHQHSVLAVQNDPERQAKQKKLDKYKHKVDKLKMEEQARERVDMEKRSRAIKTGVENCSDEDVALIAARTGELTTKDAWHLLGIAPGGDAKSHAKKLMAKLHPDRVAVEACKDGMRRRFQLVQHARDLLAGDEVTRAPAAAAAAPTGGWQG